MYLAVDPFFFAIFAGSLGGALFLSGRRGRRIGGDPHCGACNYNLSGSGAGRCPECGAELDTNTVFRGSYRPGWRGLLCGVLLGIFAVSLFGWLGFKRVRRVDPYHFYPFGLVLADAETDSLKALIESRRRYDKGKLSTTQLREMAQLTLAKCEQRPRPPEFGRWYVLLRQMSEDENLSPQETSRYCDLLIQWVQLGGRRSFFILQRLADHLSSAQRERIVGNFVKEVQRVEQDRAMGRRTRRQFRSWSYFLIHVKEQLSREQRELIIDNIAALGERQPQFEVRICQELLRALSES